MLTSRSASQEVPCPLWNPTEHERVHNSPPQVSILSQMNPVHTFPPSSHKIHSNIILPSTPRLTKMSLHFNLCSSLNVTNQVSHHTKTSKIIFLYILIFTFLERRKEDRRF